MSTCASCQNPIPQNAERCPRCAPSSEFTLGADLQIEGLGGQPSRPKKVLPAPAATSALVADRAGPASVPTRGDAIELDLDDATGGDLDIDTGTSGPSVDALRAPLAARAGSPARGGARALSGSVPEAPDLGAQARELAAYGRCASLFVAPSYALRVRRRRAELAREVQRLKAEVQRNDAGAEEAMARIGKAIRTPAAEERDLAALVAGVARAEADARAREQALAAADSSTAALTEGARERIDRIRHDLEPLEREAARLGGALKQKQDALRRVKAQLHRCEIEIRNLRDLANARDTEALGQTDPGRKGLLLAQAVELRARIPEHEAQRATHQAGIDELLEPSAKLEQELGAVKRRLAEAGTSIARIEAEKAREASALDRARQDRLRVLEGAQAAVRTQLADLARTAITRSFASELTSPLLPEAHSAAELALASQRDLELYTRALDAYDRQRVNQGYTILISASVLLLGLLVLLFVR